MTESIKIVGLRDNICLLGIRVQFNYLLAIIVLCILIVVAQGIEIVHIIQIQQVSVMREAAA